MARIHANLKNADVPFKTWKNNVIYLGEYTYGIWLIEPTGLAIQLGGQMSDPEVAKYAPFADPQWCHQECDFGLEAGEVDPEHLYEGDKVHLTQHDSVMDNIHGTKERQMIADAMKYIIYTIIIILTLMICYGVMYYCCFYGKNGKQASTDYIAI